MKNVFAVLATLLMTLSFSAPATAHCGACGVGGDADSSCEETKDCAEHPEEHAEGATE